MDSDLSVHLLSVLFAFYVIPDLAGYHRQFTSLSQRRLLFPPIVHPHVLFLALELCAIVFYNFQSLMF